MINLIYLINELLVKTYTRLTNNLIELIPMPMKNITFLRKIYRNISKVKLL
jgi:hypothetical protein